MAALRDAVVVLDSRQRDLIELFPIRHQHVNNLLVAVTAYIIVLSLSRQGCPKFSSIQSFTQAIARS